MKPVSPCERCGWKFPGFHICVDLGTPEPKIEKKVKKSGKKRSNLTMEEYWDKRRKDDIPRNDALAAIYMEGGIGLVGLSEQFGISHATVSKILRQYADAGILEIRKPGKTLQKGAV